MKLPELQNELAKAQSEAMQTRIGVRTKHLKDTSLANKKKKYIARIKTYIREIELEDAVKTAAQID